MSVKEDSQFKTTDLFTAVVLKSSGVPLESLQKETDKYVSFLFNASSNTCNKVLSQHWSGELRVPTKILIETIKELKTRVYGVIRGDHYNA